MPVVSKASTKIKVCLDIIDDRNHIIVGVAYICSAAIDIAVYISALVKEDPIVATITLFGDTTIKKGGFNTTGSNDIVVGVASSLSIAAVNPCDIIIIIIGDDGNNIMVGVTATFDITAINISFYYAFIDDNSIVVGVAGIGNIATENTIAYIGASNFAALFDDDLVAAGISIFGLAAVSSAVTDASANVI